jgi:ABC-type glycerol-3-phosphate transport system permease component
MRIRFRSLNRIGFWNIVQYVLLGCLLIACCIPILIGIQMSLKTTPQIYADFFGLPNPPQWKNYSGASLEMLRPLGNTLYIAVVSIVAGVVLSAASAYAFARLRMFGKKVLFMIILCLMMIPEVLILAPSFILANQIHLRDSFIGLILFYIGTSQPFSIFLLKTFFQDQPEELFESARIDGANEIQSLVRIALPLSRAILMTIGIMNMLFYYNDLIFPMLMLVTPAKETLMVMMQKYVPAQKSTTSRPDVAMQVAGYILACVPQLIIFIIGMKYYIQGLTSGAIKG